MSLQCDVVGGTGQERHGKSFAIWRTTLLRRRASRSVLRSKRVLTVLSNDRFSATSAVDERRLPLVTLGHGRTSLEDKVQPHIHQALLEYGPGQDTLQRANCAVRQCLATWALSSAWPTWLP